MVRGIFLILAPGLAWERVKEARRSVGFVLGVHLLPVLLLVGALEGYGLVVWGRTQGSNYIKRFALDEVIAFEAVQVALRILLVVLAAVLLRAFARTFHSRHDFRQAFTVIAFASLPAFLIRGLDSVPWMPLWLTWSVGAYFSLRALYVGVPTILDPDRPQAFGLFVLTALVLVVISGLARLSTTFYLAGRLAGLQEWIEGAARWGSG